MQRRESVAGPRSPDAVGLDTSVVLRLLRGEPPAQAERAARFLDELAAEGRTAVVSDLVISEAYFALHHFYEVPKQEAVRALADFLRSGFVSPEPGASAPEALEESLTSASKPGFVDGLIHAQYARTAGALVSFEKAARKLEGAIVLRT